MAGYIGTKAVNLSTTGADINGNANVDGTLDVTGATTVTGAFTSLGIDDNAAATAVTIDASGNVGIGTATPGSPLDVTGTLGITVSQSKSNATTKSGRIRFQHYTNAEEPVTGLLCTSAAGSTSISYGGGSGAENAATEHRFYTAGTTTTTTGSEAMRINSSGGVIAGSTDPSYGGAVAGDVVTTGGLNFNGMHVTKSKYMTLTTTTTDILECANRATYKITMSACDTSAGGFRGSQTAWLSVSNDYAGQGAIVTNVSGNLVLAWKAGSGYSVSSRTLTARTTSATANAWVITVEIMSNYARSYEGTGVGSSYFLI